MRPHILPHVVRYSVTAVLITAVLAGAGAPSSRAVAGVATPVAAALPPAVPTVDTDRERTPGTADRQATRLAALAAAARPPVPVVARPAPASRSLARVPLAPREIAKALLARRGWSSQYSCLDSLWTKESNWRVNAENRSSSAYGIPQALPGSKMSSAGPDWRSNPATQISWGLGYIAGRYGSPCAAWSHSQSHNWY